MWRSNTNHHIIVIGLCHIQTDYTCIISNLFLFVYIYISERRLNGLSVKLKIDEWIHLFVSFAFVCICLFLFVFVCVFYVNACICFLAILLVWWGVRYYSGIVLLKSQRTFTSFALCYFVSLRFLCRFCLLVLMILHPLHRIRETR